MSKKHIRLATVGTGYFSQFHYAAWQRIPEVELVAVCDQDSAAAQKIVDQYQIKTLYSDFSKMLKQQQPDLVDIITPPETHLPFIRIAAERGVNIICQKPFCGTLAQAEQAAVIADEAGVLLVVHENFRFQPWYQFIKQLLDDGLLGQVYQAQFRLRPGDGQGQDAYLQRQPYFQKMKQFLIHETGIHWVDTFRYLFGEIQSVYAHLRKLNPVIAGEDSGLLIFAFDSGVQAIFDGNRLVDHSAENRRLTMGELSIEGSEGVLQLNGDGEIFSRRFNSNEWQQHNYSWKNEGFGGDCVYQLQAHVIRHLLGSGDAYNTAEEYLTNQRIEQAIYQSADTGRTITTE